MGRVLLGVSGGIAAYKACEVTRLLVKAGHDVVPLVTPGAQQFVAERTFLALARRPAAEDLYPHLSHADLLVVAPCTANTLAKLAHGIADNLLTEAALAHRGPVLVAFGAEHGEEGLERKRAMLETKNADLVVFNDVGRSDIGFDSTDNEVVLISRDRERSVPKAAKAAVAVAILDEVERLLP
jgi:phosphopantothenoylcysteine synthetase/decarboxylase